MASSTHFKKRPLAIAVASLLTGQSCVVFADDTEPTLTLEEIVVTANRRSELIQDVPYNISAVTGDEIDAAQIQHANELLRNSVGVHVIDRGPRNNNTASSVVIRGLNLDSSIKGDSAVAGISGVSTYVGDTPLFANFRLKDVERVEMLRGPQGTLYGSGSLSGTVRYIPNEPNLEMFEASAGGYVSQTKDSDGTNWAADFMFNAPLSDTLAFRAIGGRVDNDGFVDYPNVYVLNDQGDPLYSGDILTAPATTRRVKDANWYESWNGRASLLWQPNETWRFLLSHHSQSDEVGGRQAQTEGNNGFGVPYAENELGAILLEPSSRDVSLSSLEVEADFGFATFTSSTSTYDHDGESISDNTGFNVNAGFYYYYTGTPRPMNSALRTYYDDAFVQEIRLVSNSESRFEWLVGAFYMEQKFGNTQFSDMHGWAEWAIADAAVSFHTIALDPVTGNFWRDGWQMLVDNDFFYDRNEVFTDRAIFGELSYQLTDAFKATIGLRYFDNEFESDVQLDLPPFSNFKSNVKRSVEEDDILGKLNFSYDISNDMMAYFTISEGYRRGGSNSIPTEGFYRDDPGWLVYEKDTVTNYELGLKGSTDRFIYTAALFYVDWQDAQINTSSNNGFFVVANAEDARSQGVELALKGQLTDNIHLTLGYTYTDAELTEDAIFPGNTTPSIFKGAQLPGSAENTVNFAMSYTQPLQSGNKSIVYHINGYYQDTTVLSTAETGLFAHEFPSYSMWDGSISLVAEKWNIALYAKNITDEDGAVGLYPEGWMGTNPVENFFGNDARTIIAYPRTVGVSFNYKF